MGKSALCLLPEENLFNFAHGIFEFYSSENELIEFKSPIVLLLFKHSTPNRCTPKKVNPIENWMCHFCIYYFWKERRKIQFISDLYEKLDLILLRDSKTPQHDFKTLTQNNIIFSSIWFMENCSSIPTSNHIICMYYKPRHSRHNVRNIWQQLKWYQCIFAVHVVSHEKNEIKLGNFAPYSHVHQVHCTHSLIISEMHLSNKS